MLQQLTALSLHASLRLSKQRSNALHSLEVGSDRLATAAESDRASCKKKDSSCQRLWLSSSMLQPQQQTGPERTCSWHRAALTVLPSRLCSAKANCDTAEPS